NTGFFAGYVDNTTFDSVHVINGNVNSIDYYGGLLAGGGYHTTILNSSVEGAVSGKYYLGGFLGELYDGKIENSYANVTLSGLQSIGGLVGYYESYDPNFSISNSYAKGSISGESYLGGLVGQSYRAKILNAYSQVGVTGTVNYIGGIIGSSSNLQLTNVYTTGEVTGLGLYVEVVLGRSTSGVLTGNFWDIKDTDSEESTAGGTGKSTAEIKVKSTFSDGTWDFTDTCIIRESLVDAGYITY